MSKAMDFDVLIHQHLNWKSLVESLFDDDNCNILNPTTIAKDTDCDLGKWIHSLESDFLSSNEDFQQLEEVHKNFHLYAAKIILAYQSGNLDDAKKQLPLFNQSAENIVNLLQALKKFSSIRL
ncbi:MAG: CZB domain-containing protein [Gammaproteobacteria bacterium]|nr:CZB domain-containing protein [Gammaproteobacteria bacterium]